MALCEKKQNFCFFMSFYNICTRSRDYLILFIKTGDGQKIRMLSHTIFNTSKKCNGWNENVVKNDMAE